MRRTFALIGALLATLVACQTLPEPADSAGAQRGVERLYILNCGEGVAGDISRWSPGVNVGKSMDFVDSCYLIKHARGWLLWDTGVADAVAAARILAGPLLAGRVSTRQLARVQARRWVPTAIVQSAQRMISGRVRCRVMRASTPGKNPGRSTMATPLLSTRPRAGVAGVVLGRA